MRALYAAAALLLLGTAAAAAADPAPHEADWSAPEFRFHTGETLPNLRLHYTTLGDPRNPAVLVLHGTAGSGAAMLTPAFAGTLFGPGQPLDASRYFIVLPDSLGAGASAKPSDGLRARFPRYDYTDMVEAQYRLLTEGLGLHHIRLVIGQSMGGMHAWQWAATHPGFMDAAIPMAAQPSPMSGRNWMMRRTLIEAIRRDPAWNGGNYTAQPTTWQVAYTMFGIATSGGTLNTQLRAPTTAEADRLVEQRLAAPPAADANDTLYQWDASRDYDPSAQLGAITAPVLAINAADDERNPPETDLVTHALEQVPTARLLLIPASTETTGHGTTANARFYAKQLDAFMKSLPGS